MPLQLLPLEESDLDAYENVAWEAFKDGFMRLMYPNGQGRAAREWGKHYALIDWRNHPEKFKFMKVIDTELPDDDPNNQIVGVSAWKFYLRDRTEAEMEAEANESEARGHPPDMNVPFFEEFIGNVSKCKKEILGGKAYVFLNVLATLPEYHRRGVGAMHLRWGNKQADHLGLQSYLEASPMGRPLYERMQYEKVGDLPFDARKWGLDRDLPHVIMVRPPTEMNGKP